MDIIAHTASVVPSVEMLNQLKEHPMYDKLELDFHFTKDNKLVWSHSGIINKRLIEYSEYRKLGEILTLEDVLEILDNSKAILIELKNYPFHLQRKGYMLLKILADLSYCQKPVEISSFNEHLIADLLLYQKNHELNYAELGLIVNLFKDIKYRVDFPWECKDISFVSISNELFEWPIVGSSYQFYRDLLPNVRKYAWSWDAIYTETEKRIHNYISSGVEGIITAKPELVRKLMKR